MPTRQAGGYQEEVLVASAPRTIDGNSGVLDGYGYASTLRVALNVTAASGTTPSATVVVEDTLDGVTFFPIATFAAKTAAGTEVLNVTTPFADRIRVKWTITGTTPSLTFSVTCASQAPNA
jgi:hypothetical protein